MLKIDVDIDILYNGPFILWCI